MTCWYRISDGHEVGVHAALYVALIHALGRKSAVDRLPQTWIPRA